MSYVHFYNLWNCDEVFSLFSDIFPNQTDNLEYEKIIGWLIYIRKSSWVAALCSLLFNSFMFTLHYPQTDLLSWFVTSRKLIVPVRCCVFVHRYHSLNGAEFYKMCFLLKSQFSSFVILDRLKKKREIAIKKDPTKINNEPNTNKECLKTDNVKTSDQADKSKKYQPTHWIFPAVKVIKWQTWNQKMQLLSETMLGRLMMSWLY